MTCVSSLYSAQQLQVRSSKQRRQQHTLLGRGVVDVQVKIVRLTEVVCKDNFTLQVEYGYASAVECYSRFVPARSELVKNRRRHILDGGAEQGTVHSDGEEKLSGST